MQRGYRDIISTNIMSMYPSFYELSFLWDKDSTCKVSTVQSYTMTKFIRGQSKDKVSIWDQVYTVTKFIQGQSFYNYILQYMVDSTSYTKINIEKFNILRHVTLLLLTILSLYRKGTNAPDRVMCFKTNY
jgi:hypothetical protein